MGRPQNLTILHVLQSYGLKCLTSINMKQETIILGIDPGTLIMGYGVLLLEGKKMSCLEMDVLNLKKIEDPGLKLKHIFETTRALIEKHAPDALAVEAPFFGKNVQSMLKLGRAQGVAIAAAMTCEVPFFEYAPRKIKQSITGNGNASKEQVAAMLARLTKFEEQPKYLDATDALAAAVCHALQNNLGILKPETDNQKSTRWPSGVAARHDKRVPKFSSWETFLKQNPGKIKY